MYVATFCLPFDGAILPFMGFWHLPQYTIPASQSAWDFGARGFMGFDASFACTRSKSSGAMIGSNSGSFGIAQSSFAWGCCFIPGLRRCCRLPLNIVNFPCVFLFHDGNPR